MQRDSRTLFEMWCRWWMPDMVNNKWNPMQSQRVEEKARVFPALVENLPIGSTRAPFHSELLYNTCSSYHLHSTLHRHTIQLVQPVTSSRHELHDTPLSSPSRHSFLILSSFSRHSPTLSSSFFHLFSTFFSSGLAGGSASFTLSNRSVPKIDWNYWC